MEEAAERDNTMKKCMILGLALLAGSVAQAATVDFHAFNIRNNDGSITAPWDSDMSIIENAAGDGFSAMTPRSGQKVGYGTNAFDGCELNDLASVDWDKVSGAANVSYLNIWVTDGTNYAVISSENDYRGTDFATRNQWKIFEYGPGAGFDWLFDAGTGGRSSQYLTLNGSNATLADISDDVKIFAGPVGPTVGVGTGAPRGGYGFNLIYGDTASNFLGAYHLENLTVTLNKGAGPEVFAASAPVPEPATVSLLLMGLGGLAARARRKKA
jgi:hypothetical protein